ncbi:MAG TPA: beta-ketoacyl-ACP synthase III [Chthoniobacterales bacterium]|jgi:3-oxoacyl-[acyl-carrier-protein] synthase III|nr:beta-ketoacyl-ACP synthase III [Chthoniobacterales bacterium]
MKSPPSQPRRFRKPHRTVSIIGTGSYVPERVLTNRELEKMVETSDEWIRTRTGISERRIAGPDEATSDMSTKAALAAMQQAEVAPEEIDLIVVATVTPDMFFPATACWVQKKIGAIHAACFDVSAACSGFLYAMEIAQQFISTHVYNTVLIIGADKLSSIVNWSDRNTCVLFGDGAGAAILRNRADSHGVIATHMGSDGEFTDILFMPGGGSRFPTTPENIHQNLNTIKMLGKETYKQAVTAMSNAADRALEAAGLKYDDIACVIPHQANMRIIEAIAHRMNLPIEKFYVNLEKYGNTSAAAVAIALDEAHRAGRFRIGDYILLVVFGGGLTWASSVIQW